MASSIGGIKQKNVFFFSLSLVACVQTLPLPPAFFDAEKGGEGREIGEPGSKGGGNSAGGGSRDGGKRDSQGGGNILQ